MRFRFLVLETSAAPAPQAKKLAENYIPDWCRLEHLARADAAPTGRSHPGPRPARVCVHLDTHACTYTPIPPPH